MANGSRLIRFFEGSAILSRFEILSARSLTYADQALLPPEHRIALRVRMRSESRNIEIVGTHLTNTTARKGGRLKRTLQARELTASLSRDRVENALFLIGGDFNDVPGSETIKEMVSAGAKDAWREASSRSGQSDGAGFTALMGTVADPGATADARIDYLFFLGKGARY